MKCADVADRLSAYADGELEAEMREKIVAHLSRCPACRAELTALAKLDGLIRKISPVESCFDAAQIVSRIQPSPPPRRRFFETVESVFRTLTDILCSPHPMRTGGGSLHEFDDFPPLLLGRAYFRLL